MIYEECSPWLRHSPAVHSPREQNKEVGELGHTSGPSKPPQDEHLCGSSVASVSGGALPAFPSVCTSVRVWGKGTVTAFVSLCFV